MNGQAITSEQLLDIPLDDIFMDEEFNCRKDITPTSVMQLANSILEKGLHQPIMVMPYTKEEGKKYKIIMGHRRYKAHIVNRHLHKDRASTTIKARVNSTMTEQEAMMANLTENIERQELNILEEAQAVQKLMLTGLGLPQIAKALNKSLGWVQVRDALVHLPAEVKYEASMGVLSNQQILDCHKLAETQGLDACYEYVRKIKDAKLAGKEKPVAPSSIKGKTKNRKKVRSPDDMIELQDLIRAKIGNGIETQILAWCGGVIDDLALHQALKKHIEAQGGSYIIPMALSMPRSVLIR